MLKSDQVYQYFSLHSLKIFLLVLTSWKTHESFQNNQFFVEKTLYKYCPASIATTFRTKFVPGAKVHFLKFIKLRPLWHLAQPNEFFEILNLSKI